MDIEQLLTERFTEAIRKSFRQCPLIGPKWFRYHDNATPPYFRFTGARRLAKATSSNSRHVAERIVRNLNTRGLDAEVEISSDCTINVRFKKLPDVT